MIIVVMISLNECGLAQWSGKQDWTEDDEDGLIYLIGRKETFILQ